MRVHLVYDSQWGDHVGWYSQQLFEQTGLEIVRCQVHDLRAELFKEDSLIIVMMIESLSDLWNDRVSIFKKFARRAKLVAHVLDAGLRTRDRILTWEVDHIVDAAPGSQEAVDELSSVAENLLTQNGKHIQRILNRRLGRYHLVGSSDSFLDQVEKVSVYARASLSVLIEGETGTGKEGFARALHYLSPRAHGPFVALNCGSVSDQLLENELFGHVRGAYTGAHSASHGLLGEAANGTLFLDEANSMSEAAQVKLLRFLEDGSYRPVGSTVSRELDVRIVAASNQPLLETCKRGKFRDDLYHRISVLTLKLPRLCERLSDIPQLAKFFLDRYCKGEGLPPHYFSPEAMNKLMHYSWPGNIRELRNLVERAVVLCKTNVIRHASLAFEGEPPKPELGTSSKRVVTAGPFHECKKAMLAEFERAYVSESLAIANGNVSHAAERAQLDRRSFQRLMRKYSL